MGLNRAGKPVIKIYKEKPDVADVPDSLDDVPVESVTTGILQARAPTDRFPRPVPIGVSAGDQGTTTGTLGVRVTNGTNVYALSNNHVFAAVNSANIGDGVIQPGAVDGGSDPADRIGTLSDYQTIDFDDGDTNTIDAAIALTSVANVGTATPPDGYGTPSPVTTQAFIGQAVQKYGRTTGLQLGSVAEINVTVDVCYVVFFDFCLEDARFVNQISVTPGPFSAPGDSGSLIVTQGANQPVALLFAGGEGLTIGNPIDAVLQRFNVTIDGSAPPAGPPGPPTSLSALSGDASITLSWVAPTFDGGSPVSGYRIYRDTSPNPTTALADVGLVTSLADSGLVNGQTYYYKVSALNANGEGSLSNQASATPAALVLPVTPLPVLDDFNRGFENPLSDSGRWSNGANGSAETGLYVPSTWLACSKTTTCTSWRSNTQYGPDTEVWARLSVLPGDNNQLRLYARLQQPGTTTYDGYMLRTNQLPGTDQVLIDRVDNGAFVNRLTVNQELVAGDLLLLRSEGQTLEAWRHNGTTWSRLGFVTDTTYGGVGHVGVGLRGTTGRADDFGARTLGSATNPPGPPTSLSALSGDASITLSWVAPTFDGGSPVSGYRIYRDTSPNPTTALADVGLVTSLADSGLVNGQTYYYKVSALNANGEGSLSNQASATPAALVLPVTPLPVLDDFNRGFENPLSDSGRWSNGANGSAETGLYVPSTWLACSKTTTCTSWRSNTQYGPDTEVWARLSVLPGDNNQLRLYARLQQPGTTTYDGYMLRTNQLPGTDQVLIDRVDNGAFVNRLTVNQELVAGDLLLLRSEGQTLEAWRHNGTTWSRLGFVTDTTYGGVGHVGVGLRGTTGRADDFGARTLGAPPPDTEPPGAPGTLSASALSASQINLSWLAATDNVGVARYRIERCEGSACSVFSEIATTTGTSYANSGLAASTSYSYRVRAEDAVPNLGPFSNVATASTQTPPDTEPPGAPGTLSASALSASQINLSWLAATDNVGVARYRIERCEGSACSVFSEIATTTGTSYANSGLAASTSYSYRVRAEDAVPNLGPFSNVATASTQTPPDTEPPGAPGTLSASALSASQINLSWLAATDNVGVARYRIERCEGSACSVFSEIATTTGTSYANSGLAASTSYSYRVRAEDAVPNLGPFSNVASATTFNLVPVEPLPALDSFNRRNENPLSDSGRWSNGVSGSVETGLRVASNALECTKTATCTAWRNNTQFGADTEVWARVTTLPGANNQFRLYARLQQPGTTTYDGYMLRTNQLPGTDQVLIDRVDNGAFVNRLTISQELAVGDVLLLRVRGSTLEAWHRRGTTWSSLGSVADSTYSGAGYVGVGIRGKTGRLDDFGAR